MDALARFFRKLGLLLHRSRFNSDLDEEMAFHRELQQNDLQYDGMATEEAQHAARRQFGNDTRLKEQSHEIVGFRMESVFQDLRFATRQLRKSPSFAVVTVLVLALGICASVAIYAFVDAALLKPLPYQDPSRLAGVYESIPQCHHCALSYADYFDWKKNNKVFSSFDAWTGSGYLLHQPSGGVLVKAARVTDGFFTTLGIKPALGRAFYPGENSPSAPQSVILTYTAWKKYFNGRTDILGKPVTLSNDPYTVIGVLPASFQFAPRGGVEFWTTIHTPNGCETRRGCHNLSGIARLKDGVSVETALANIKSIAAQLETQYPDSNRGQGATVLPLSEDILSDIRPILLILLSGAALLLLIACINISSLLLVRAETRKREMAVRGALGASRSRIVRQFTLEAVVLVTTGTMLGLGSAYAAMHLLLRLIPEAMLEHMPYLQRIDFSPRVLLFAAVLSLLAGVLFTITPSLRISLSNLREELAEGSRGSSGTIWRRFGANFVIAELAIAVVLLAAAGLLGKSFYHLLHVELNFDSNHLAVFDVEAVDKKYGQYDQAVALGQQITSRLQSIPGVQSVGFSSQLPLEGNGNTTWIRIQGHPYNGEHNEANERDVNAGFFSTIKPRLISGRFFTENEVVSKRHVMVINRALARKYFPGEDPIGKRIGGITLAPDSMYEVVGVVDDIREGSLDNEIWPAVYYPIMPDSDVGVVVRTSQEPASLLPTFIAAIRQIDPNITTVHESSMTGVMDDSPTAYIHRAATWLVGCFAVFALLLSVVGLYGVIAYSVGQRTREIGVRMALGAQRSAVYRLILREAGWLTAIGIGVGLGCAIAAATLMSKLLFGVTSWDLPTLGTVAAVLGVSALLASYIPARRAASVNPVEALRSE